VEHRRSTQISKTLAARICAFCTGEQVVGAAVVNVGALVRFPSAALVRQRARLAESLRGLITGEWNTP